jgi:hypothetical protein
MFGPAIVYLLFPGIHLYFFYVLTLGVVRLDIYNSDN